MKFLILLCTVCICAIGVRAGTQVHQSGTNAPVFTEICVANIDQTVDYSNHYGGWVEVYNPSADAVSLDGWYISDNADVPAKHKLTNMGVLNPGAYKCIFFDHHASEGVYGKNANKQVGFKLDRNGGSLFLSADGTKADVALTYPSSIPRCSYALTRVGGTEWAYCGAPTPGAANAGQFSQTRLGAPEVSCDSRLFTTGFSVHVSVPAGTTLRYTLDGSTPTMSHGQSSADGVFEISGTTVLRMCLVADGYLPGPVVTRTYIFKDRDYYLPIVAISTDPRNLYDDYIGCYVDGKNGVTGRGSKGESNLNMDWERPVNLEFLTPDGEMVLNQECSFEVMGGYSRHFPPASFKLRAKKIYEGKGSFKHPVFPGKPYCKYDELIVRNGGNNNRTYGGPRIWDAVTQQALASSGFYLDTQEFQPAHVFVNGKYLAMLNVREPTNKYHGCANYGYDKDEMDSFEYYKQYVQKNGNREAFDRMILLSEQAATDAGFRAVCELLDMDEFVHYMATICYTGSYDWLLNSNNVKGYRTWDDGKFHFVLFDQDLSWQRSNNVEAIDGVTTNEVLVLYNNLKKNPTFRQQFVTSYCILYGSVYAPERCRFIVDSICDLVTKALSYDSRYTNLTRRELEKGMWGQKVREERMQSLMNAYGLTDGKNVIINTNHAKACIHINGQQLPFNHFGGRLFDAAKVIAQSAAGYDFMGWQDENGSWITRQPECAVNRDGVYTAIYESQFRSELSPLCVNEVSRGNGVFVNDYGKREDWIELYNRGEEPIDVSKLYFSDDSAALSTCQVMAAPGVNTVVKPNEHVVIWCDDSPSVTQLHLPFKLKTGRGCFLSIRPADGSWCESFEYSRHSPVQTIGRYPDGGNKLYTFYHSTIGKQNLQTMYDAYVDSISNTIESIPSPADIASVAYYTMDGVKTEPRKGIYIKVVYYRVSRFLVWITI